MHGKVTISLLQQMKRERKKSAALSLGTIRSRGSPTVPDSISSRLAIRSAFDTATLDSLKALDPNRPIREADIRDFRYG
jgi:hypothetical protein